MFKAFHYLYPVDLKDTILMYFISRYLYQKFSMTFPFSTFGMDFYVFNFVK